MHIVPAATSKVPGNIMQAILDYWKNHGTKALGTASTVVGALLASPVVPPGSVRTGLEIAGLVLGALTVKRGYVNSKNGAV